MDSKIQFDSQHRFHSFIIFASLLLMHCQSCHSLEGASSDDARVLFGGHGWDRLKCQVMFAGSLRPGELSFSPGFVAMVQLGLWLWDALGIGSSNYRY